jgi:2-methylcitrate dehydratase
MIEEKIAGYVSKITFTSIDDSNLHILKRNILDSYAGICLSLQDTEMIRKFDALTDLSPDEKGMSVWGINKKASAADAVFMNTILARRSDLLNTYMSPNKMGVNHPSDNVALVLALADWLGKSGQDLLTYTYTAFVLSCAYSDYYNPEPAKYDHDAQAIFYTALIIGYVMGLNEAQLVEVQRMAGVFGLDIDQTAMGEVTDWKHCTYASCALRGMHIARMALAGFESAKNIYEGEAGVNQFFPHSKTMLEKLPDLSRIVFKRWPSLVFCQTPIDVALDISEKIDNPYAIDKIEVQSFQEGIKNAGTSGAYSPVSRAGRTHSYPYCVAAALLKKTIEYSYFNDDFAAKETAVTNLMSKVKIIENPDMTKKFPDGAPCRIIVTMKDGTVIDKSRDYSKGDPHDPLSDKELEEKVLKNMKLIMDEKTANDIVSRIWSIEKEEDISWLVAPLKKNLL